MILFLIFLKTLLQRVTMRKSNDNYSPKMFFLKNGRNVGGQNLSGYTVRVFSLFVPQSMFWPWFRHSQMTLARFWTLVGNGQHFFRTWRQFCYYFWNTSCFKRIFMIFVSLVKIAAWKSEILGTCLFFRVCYSFLAGNCHYLCIHVHVRWPIIKSCLI